ncbi:MAG TPA: tetratricopeptide repeat protein [Candidatus Baltobacteraceae bacterium]
MQAASDAIFASAGSAISLPAHLPAAAGIGIYRAIERIAPAQYVEGMLARAELARGNLDAAQQHALRLPSAGLRDEYLGRIAQARGDESAAQAYFLAGADFFAIQDDVDRLAKSDPAAAYDLERTLKNRLQALTTHPDAVAESYWHLGQIATMRSWPYAVGSTARRHWTQVGMRDYRRAVALSPLAERYLLAAGTQALALGDLAGARGFYARAVDVNPASADAFAGLGVVALRAGDRASAQRYAARSRTIDPNSAMLRALQADLR